MNKWLDIMQFIVLIILTIIFVFYVFKKNESENAINKVVESFGVSTDYHGKYFDLSSNYNTLNDNEKPAIMPAQLEKIILNIGGSFGDDNMEIPWDSENKELTQQEALWGVVPRETSGILFRKMYMVNQIDNEEQLEFDENNNAYFRDPMFGFGTVDKRVSDFAQTYDFQLQTAFQLVVGIYIEKAWPVEKETAIIDKAIAAYNKALTSTDPKALAKLGELQKDIDIAASHVYKNVAQHEKDYEKAFLKAFGKERETFTFRALKFVTKPIHGPLRTLKAGLKNVFGNNGRLVEGIAGDKAASVAERLAARSATTKATEQAAIATTKKVATEIGEKLGAKLERKIGLMLGKRIAQKVTSLLVASGVFVACVNVMALIPYLTAIMEEINMFYMVIIMPLVIVLTLPGGPITKLMDSWASTTGCCLPGTVALDVALPELIMIIISMIPILGDILSIVYPYVCMKVGTGALSAKTTLPTPRYIYNKQYLSCFYLDWPSYNCSYEGHTEVWGKIPLAEINAPHNSDHPYSGLSQWLMYTDFNKVIADPAAHTQVDKQMTGFRAVYNSNTILPVGWDKPFFYCDFSDPYVMIQMAQLYYNYASASPYDNGDGTVSIQYISKINYVIASTLATCDVICEMNNVTYNPLGGGRYSEVVSVGHDRRFYFGIDYDKLCPPHWESKDPSNTITNSKMAATTWPAGHNTQWVTIDDAYDQALYELNNEIHNDDKYNNDSLSAEVLATAYRLQIHSYNNYVNARANAYNDPFVSSNFIINQYQSQYMIDFANYSNLIIYNLRPSNVVNPPWDTINPTTTIPFSYNAIDTNIKTVEQKLSTLVGRSNAYWEYQKQISDPEINTYKQYKVWGCTHLDGTAGTVGEPDVTSLQEDYRKEVNFNVLPYIVRCTKPTISINQCIDLSNITQIVDAYSVLKPNVHIKTIKNIKTKGQNVCQYIWDEVTYDPVTQKELVYSSNVTNNILYQTDLSSCTFCLPNDPSIPNSKLLYGATVGGVASSIPGPTTTTIPMVIPTIVGGVIQKNAAGATITTNQQVPSTNMYKNYTPVYNIDNQIIKSPNINEILSYKKTSYYVPTKDPQLDIVSTVTLVPNADDIIYYDTRLCSQLSTIIRPKKPIRVTYPSPPEKLLGNNPNDVCANSTTMQHFIMDYNNNPKNTDSKILKITRAYTSSSNTCDYEFDTVTGKSVQRVTQTFSMAEGFQTLPTIPPYTYNPNTLSNNQTTVSYFGPAAYVGKGEGAGLNINKLTAGLPGSLSSIGFGFGTPYVDQFKTSVGSNISYFNDSLIQTFTSTTQLLNKATNSYLVALKGTTYLGGDTSCSSLQIKCSNSDVMQRIIEQYNIDNYPTGRYGVERDSVIQIIRAATDSVSTCHVIFENNKEIYTDAYSDTTYINANDNSTADISNYYTENNLYLKEFQMKPSAAGSCTFVPVPNSVIDISATDLALTSALDFNTYVLPVRTNCLVATGSNALSMQALRDYANITKNRGNTVYASMRLAPNIVDYGIFSQIFNIEGYPMIDREYVLRVTYNYPIYTGSATCSAFTYTSGNYEVQLPGSNVDTLSETLSPIFSYVFLQDSITTTGGIDTTLINGFEPN